MKSEKEALMTGNIKNAHSECVSPGGRSTRRHIRLLYVGIFLFTVLFYVVVLAIQGSYPFGSRSFLTYDAYVQYKNIYHALFEWLASDDKGAYLWNIGLGVDVYQELIYYCLSPFSLIVLLMGEKNIELSMVIMLIAKASCLSPAALYFFRHTNKKNTSAGMDCGIEMLVQFTCALAYGLCGYVLAYGHNTMWLDSMILLPFIARGVERFSAGENRRAYIICLALSFILNFYFSLYICIFAAIYFLLEDRDGFGLFVRRGFEFLGASVLSLMMAGVVIVPAACVVLSAAASSDTLSLHEITWGQIGEFIASFYPLKTIKCESLFCNNSFCGSVVILLAFICITSGCRSVKSKIKYSLAVGVLVLALNWLPLNYVFHGFALTHGLGNRFAIVLVFLLIIMAYIAVQNMDSLSMTSVIVSAVLAVAVFIVSMIDNRDMSAPVAYMIVMFSLVVYIALLIFYVRGSVRPTPLVCILAVLWIAELVGSGVYTMSYKYNDELPAESTAKADWSDVYEELETTAGERKTAMVMENVAKYSQTSWYSSMSNGNTIRAFSSMGLSHYDNVEYMYSGTTPITAMMYNVRYVLTNEHGTFGGYHMTDAEHGDVKTGYDSTDESEGYLTGNGITYRLYEADELAGSGFMVDSNIESWDADGVALENQNEFVRYGLGIDGALFTELDMSGMEYVYYNLKVLDEDVGYFRYSTTNSFAPIVWYEFDADEDVDLYIDSSDTRYQYVEAYVDGEKVVDNTPYMTGFVSHVGTVHKGQHVKICVGAETAANVGEVGEKCVRLYTFNNDVYEQAKAAILDETLTCTGFEDDSFHGKVTAQSDGILYLAYPYNDGFIVYVDGEKTDKVRLGSGNMGVAVTAGEHEIVIEYNTPGLPVGIILSICGIALFVGLSVRNKRKIHD